MEYFKSSNRYTRFDHSTGKLITIDNNLVVSHISIQLIEENRRSSMSSMLNTNNTVITENEFNVALDTAKTTINNL